jgi:hypothetical protein
LLTIRVGTGISRAAHPKVGIPSFSGRPLHYCIYREWLKKKVYSFFIPLTICVTL